MREREILEALANGHTNAQIATQLCSSPYTVRAHLEHLFEKLNAKTRTEAARSRPRATTSVAATLTKG